MDIFKQNQTTNTHTHKKLIHIPTHTHTHTHIYIYIYTCIHNIVILQYTLSYTALDKQDIGHHTPYVASLSSDNSANRRSTSCPMSLKAPAACDFETGDVSAEKDGGGLTRVSAFDIFTGHVPMHIYIYI